MTEFNNDPYSVLFSQLASKLESHLLKYGVACADADMIIEESSILYFRKLNSSKKKLFKLLKRQNPETIFIDSACQVIGRLIPEAKQNFGSYNVISKCIQ